MIFVFEYTCCAEEFGDLSVEGLLMFKTLLDSKLEKVAFVRSDLDLELPKTKDWKRDFRRCLEECDYFLVVAPENGNILYDLTRLGEKYCENLGNPSKTIRICSDKYKLYKKLKGKVNMPETSLKPLDCKFVIKPRKSCDGEGIRFSEEVPEGYVAQEYVDGLSVSVGLMVGEDVNVLSVNRQILDGFRFKGFLTPYEVGKVVVEEALKVVDVLNFHGYVGIDLVVSDLPYVVDVNARLTTTSIALKEVYGIDLLDSIFRNHVGCLKLDLKPMRLFKFVKGVSA